MICRRLVLANLQVANCDVSTIVVDTPAVLLDAIDAVGITANIIDVHHADAVVGIDSDMINIVARTIEYIAIDTLDESLAFLTILLEVNLANILVLRIHYHRIILLGVCATYKRNAELVGVA